MFCMECGSEINDKAVVCVKCGVAVRPMPGSLGKSRTTSMLLGILCSFFGFPGIHNFYAGNTERGTLQLLLTILTCWILWIPMLVWAMIEACTVTVDSLGNPMS